MSGAITLKRYFRANRASGRRKGQGEVDSQSSRVPRISRLMALAIYFDQLIRDGVVADQAELARLGHVSRARLTQIMNLLNLAPDIQEEVLIKSTLRACRPCFTEKSLRALSLEMNWAVQRKMWQTV